MSIILNIETSSKNCSVCLSSKGNLVTSFDLEDEAYRIMIKLPSFEPAKYKEKYVTTSYGTTISFKLNQ